MRVRLAFFAPLAAIFAMPSAAEAYYRAAPSFHYSAPAPVYHYNPPVQRYVPRQQYVPQQRYVPRQTFNPQPRYAPQQQYRQQPGQNYRPNAGMRPAVVQPNPRGQGPGVVATRLPAGQIPHYHAAHVVGGAMVGGAGAYYFINPGNVSTVVPDNTGDSFDVEAFVRALTDAGVPPDDQAPDDLAPPDDSTPDQE